MMAAMKASRCIVNHADGRYAKGHRRLRRLAEVDGENFLGWSPKLPPGSLPHFLVNYQFKAFALMAAKDSGYTSILWCDASIVPVKPLSFLWEKIERDGYWVSKNRDYTNAEWTADSAYSDLGVTPEENVQIPHVMTTAFGLNLKHRLGRAMYEEFLRLAQTKVFNGPWKNRNHPDHRDELESLRCYPCGPSTVRGHRHDQTALSVITYKLGLELTVPPAWIEYKGLETDDTVLLADGDY